MASNFGAARSRRRTPLSSYLPFVVVLAVLALLFVLVRVIVNRFEPLDAGALVLPPGTRVADQRSDTVSTYRVSWREGQVLTYGMTVRNDGPFDVRVVGVAAPRAAGAARAQLVRVRMADPDRREFRPRQGEPFREFTLESGEERWLLVEVRLTGCQPKTAPSRLDRMPVRWSSWGLDRQTDVPLGMAVELVPAANCGRRG